MKYYVKYDTLLHIKLTQGGYKMIIYNQTQDFFNHNAHYEATPSQIMDQEYQASLIKMQDSTDCTDYSIKRWKLERQYQQTFFEEDVDKLLSYAVATVNLISKIKEHQDFPMVDFDYWDSRDFPQIYAECLDFYSQTADLENTLPRKFVLEQVPFTRICFEKTFIVSDIKKAFKEVERIFKQLEKIHFYRNRVNELRVMFGRKPVFVGNLELHPKDITLHNIAVLKELYEKQISSYIRMCDKLEFWYKRRKYREAAKKMDKYKGLIFSVEQSFFLQLFDEIPQIMKNCKAFIVNRETPEETIEEYLHKIEYSEHYYVTYF